MARVLREAETGTEFTVTVRGRPIARVVPLDNPPPPRLEVDRDTIARILQSPIDTDALAEDLDAAEAPLDDPWPDA